MVKKLDVARIEKARRKEQSEDRRELEKKRIQETIAQNRRGERKGRVIMPSHKEYAYRPGSGTRYKVTGVFDMENKVLYFDMTTAVVSEYRASKG